MDSHLPQINATNSAHVIGGDGMLAAFIAEQLDPGNEENELAQTGHRSVAMATADN